jgi:hypothetical protein
MQKYGQDVSGKLRLIGLNTRGVATSQNLAESQRQQQGAAWGPSWSGGGSYGWGYGGGYNYNYNPGGMWYSNNYQEVKTAQTAASAKGQKERNEIWNQLNENSNIIRQRMSSKYKIGF